MKTFLLRIYTPLKKYFDGYVKEITLSTDDFELGILPHHTPLVAKIRVCRLTIYFANNYQTYAVSEGMLNVKKDEVVITVESIEHKDEIDILRAKGAKARALKLLSERVNIDIERANKALERANNRIKVYEGKKEIVDDELLA